MDSTPRTLTLIVMTDRETILVVEDEAAIRSGLCDVLSFHGHQPTGVGTGEEGLRESLTGRYALILLDIMLPGVSGFDICRQVRQQLPDQAVLMLTAKGSEEDILEGFRCGADDYVTKPFSVAQLMARIDSLLRRTRPDHQPPTEPFRFATWQIDPRQRMATDGARNTSLSAREVQLLALFSSERGRIVSRRRLLTEVWGVQPGAEVHTRTVDMHIAKLRKKLAGSDTGIETVRGEGYRYLG